MKKILTFLSITALSLVFINSSHAQMFQNTNTDCEETAVLSIQGGSNSIACQNIAGGADFNGDGFPDCALLTPNTDLGDPNVLSVLMNLGAGSTSCSGGAGDQFDAASNYTVSGLAGSTVGTLGSIVAGPISITSSFNDVAAPNLTAGSDMYATASSVAAGGFGATSPITSSDVNWDFSTFDSTFRNSLADRTSALFDCDNDGDMDAGIIVGNTSADFFRVNLMINNGSALAAASSATDTGIVFTGGDIGALAVGDFNNDNNDDVVVTMTPTSGTLANNSIVQVCTNNGACVLTCQTATQFNLNDLHAASDPTPSSIVAGDFNGDGNIDAAVNTPGLDTTAQGVDFLFGNGSAVFTSSLALNFAPSASTGDPETLTTGCYDNDNNTDVALTFGSDAASSARVGVFTRITSASATTTTLTFNGTNIISPGGIDSADFDGLGGDDILMVATDVVNTANPRQAFVFMNSVETIVADAGTPQTITTGSVASLTGTCAMDPADATAVFSQLWTVSPTSGATLTNATTLTPTLTATTAGTYTVTLTCTSRCDDIATDTVVITFAPTIPDILEGSGLNGCSLGNAGSVSSMLGYLSVLVSMIGMYVVRKKNS